MARGGAGAKVQPSLARMAGARARTADSSQAEGGHGGRPARLPPRDGRAEDKPPRYGSAGRERSRYGPAPRHETSPAEARRPPSPLKAPRPLAIEAEDGPDGPVPRWVTWRGKRRPVAAVEDDWRVDDEWWRNEISRHYFAVTLADGCRLILFLDRIAGTWWEQSC